MDVKKYTTSLTCSYDLNDCAQKAIMSFKGNKIRMARSINHRTMCTQITKTCNKEKECKGDHEKDKAHSPLKESLHISCIR